jgi:hypothetical protein
MSKGSASEVIFKNDYRTRYINYITRGAIKNKVLYNINGGSGAANEASEVIYKNIGGTQVAADELAILLSASPPTVSIGSTLIRGLPIPLATTVTPAGIFMTDGSATLYNVGTGAKITFPRRITSISTDPSGNLYVATSNAVYANTPNGIVNMNISGLGNVSAMIAGPPFYFIQGSQIYIGYPNSAAVPIAGSAGVGYADGPGATAKFSTPMGFALDSVSGILWIADTGQSLIRALRTSPPYTVSTIAGNSTQFINSLQTDNVGNRDGNGIHGENLLYNPQGITVSPRGVVYIADTGNNTIRALVDGNLTTISGQPGTQPVYDKSPSGYLDSTAEGSLWNYPTSLTYYNSVLYITEPLNSAVRFLTLV